MSTTLKYNLQRNRKDYQCHDCERIIPKGEQMYYGFGVDGGVSFSWRTCKTCDAIIGFLPWYDKVNGLEFGHIKESVRHALSRGDVQAGATPEYLLEYLKAKEAKK